MVDGSPTIPQTVSWEDPLGGLLGGSLGGRWGVVWGVAGGSVWGGTIGVMAERLIDTLEYDTRNAPPLPTQPYLYI